MSTRSTIDEAMDGAGSNADMEGIGIANVMERLGEGAPAVLQMQAGLLAGIVRSQREQAVRLAKSSPHSAMLAEARAERFDQLQQEFAGIGSAVANIIEGQIQRGVFHGFVFTAGGTPAVGYKVEVQGLVSKSQKAVTDDTGYFRMAFNSQAKGKATKEEAERYAGATEAFNSDKSAKAATVTVSSPSGRRLFTDPTPPSADEGSSIFRYYPLPVESSTGRKPRAGDPEARASGKRSK